MTTASLYSIVSVLLVSAISLIGVLLLFLRPSLLQRILLLLVSFAAGALLANVFIHMLPEALHDAADPVHPLLLVLGGILLSFLLEQAIHWHHCHSPHCEHIKSVGVMMLIGDGLHNLLDGMLIATAYLISIPLGITTTVAVVLHEIPQEIGDFSVLLHSGFRRITALFWNFVSALTAVLGALLVLVLHEHVHDIEHVFLPIAAGNFLYIAIADLMPEMRREQRIPKIFLQFLSLLLGIGLLYFLMLFAPGHEDVHAATDDVHVESDIEEYVL